MEDNRLDFTTAEAPRDGNISRFVDSYASFQRIVNSLQRKYIELREEFAAQNQKLADANHELTDLSDLNIKNNEFLNGILNSISVGVVAIDHDGRITHFNPAASVILGVPPNEPVGKRYASVLPIGRPADASALATAIIGQTVESVEKQVELKDGSIGNLSVSTAILADSQGNPAGAVEVFQDLTKLRQMEQEIARLTTLAALGEMAATIAHQVRNPLAGIGGFASLLERDLDESDPKRKLVAKIKRGVESLNDTVTALLNYSRSDELNLASVVYSEFLSSSLDEYRSANAERIGQVTIRSMPAGPGTLKPVTVTIDRLLIRQVLTNLLDNSIDVLGGDGSIAVSYRVLPRQSAIDIYSDRLILGVDETVLETVITDDGPGISDEHADRVFAPFYSTKQNGHGLGLAAAAKIMKAHGGDILIDKSVTVGVAFKLLLPVRIDSANMERNA